jgi:hypothetical protein
VKRLKSAKNVYTPACSLRSLSGFVIFSGILRCSKARIHTDQSLGIHYHHHCHCRRCILAHRPPSRSDRPESGSSPFSKSSTDYASSHPVRVFQADLTESASQTGHYGTMTFARCSRGPGWEGQWIPIYRCQRPKVCSLCQICLQLSFEDPLP